jgi:hypothetical protein
LLASLSACGAIVLAVTVVLVGRSVKALKVRGTSKECSIRPL